MVGLSRLRVGRFQKHGKTSTNKRDMMRHGGEKYKLESASRITMAACCPLWLCLFRLRAIMVNSHSDNGQSLLVLNRILYSKFSSGTRTNLQVYLGSYLLLRSIGRYYL